MHAIKLNASLKSLEGERDQIHTQLCKVDKRKDSTENLKNLQNEYIILQSEYTQAEIENQNILQNV
jgi:hypothetical protein